MDQLQIFAKSFGRITTLAIMLISLIAITANSAIAQSTDIGNPTRLTSNEISGSFDSDNQRDNYFYSFTAGSGELVITFSLKGSVGLTVAQYSVAVIDENSKELGSKFVTTNSGNTEQQVLRVNVPRKQVVLLRIRGLGIIGGTASYRVRISGAIELSQNGSTTPTKDKIDRADCLPKQGTLIIKMKDGSKKIIDLSEADTITIVP